MPRGLSCEMHVRYGPLPPASSPGVVPRSLVPFKAIAAFPARYLRSPKSQVQARSHVRFWGVWKGSPTRCVCLAVGEVYVRGY